MAEWVITEEFVTFYKDENIGIAFSVSNKNTRKKIIRKGTKFRMVGDDDRETKCVGYCIINGGNYSAPLLDFGADAFNAAHIEYYINGEWREYNVKETAYQNKLSGVKVV